MSAAKPDHPPLRSYSDLTPDEVSALTARGRAVRSQVFAAFFARLAQGLRRPADHHAGRTPSLRPSH